MAGWVDPIRKVLGWLSSVPVNENPETVEVEFNVQRTITATMDLTRSVSRDFEVARTIDLTTER